MFYDSLHDSHYNRSVVDWSIVRNVRSGTRFIAWIDDACFPLCWDEGIFQGDIEYIEQ